MRLLAAEDANTELRQAAADMLALDPGDTDASAYSRGLSPFTGTPQQTLTAGLNALNARQFADAAEWFRAGILADPRSADAWNNRGWAQYQLGFIPIARASFERALQIDPNHGRARNNLALLGIPR
jgi:Flp pilus assembly protein TadD